MKPEIETFGILVIDTNGNTVCATGIACDQDIRERIERGWRGARPGNAAAGMFALDGDRKLLTVYRTTADATAFLVQAHSDKSALFDMIGSVDFAYDIFNSLVNSPYESMIVVDDQARIKFIPPIHEAFFGMRRGEAIGKHVTEVIENTNLHEVVKTGKAEIGKLQEMGGVTRVVARVPIIRDGKTLGALGRVMFKGPETVEALGREVTKLRSEVQFYRNELSDLKRRSHTLDQMIGKGEAMRQLKADIMKVAPLYVPVLITGESGTGKELAAHALHAMSPRNDNAMVLVNAAALPPGLVESELFGYEAGAFTGAEKKGRKGKFELADRSSLFLDEIGDMPVDTQVKMLRVLQDGIFERVGGDRARHSDFRLICASNRNFQEMISKNEFRLDLYYRISAVTIRMPSLSERLEDIPDLVNSFLAAFASRQGRSINSVDHRVYDYLKQLPWPGNVRQLLHEVERAAIFCDGPEIRIENFRALSDAQRQSTFSTQPAPSTQPSGIAGASISGLPAGGRIQHAVDEVEKIMIREALLRHRGNKKKAAEELGISRAYLYKKLDEE